MSCSIPVDKLCELLLPWGARHVRYVCNIKDKLEDLKLDVDSLRSKKNDVANKVETEESKGFRRLDQVTFWLDQVQKNISDFEALSEYISNTRDGCCSIKSHYKAGKSLAKLAKIVEGLKGQTFDEVVYQPPPPTVTLRHSQPPIGVAYALTEVRNHLKDDHVGIIGLYGMGGIGKTTILTELNNELACCTDSNLGFDLVIWVSVSKDINLSEVLNDIGKRIGREDEEWKRKSLDDRASCIFQALNRKNFLLLLDNVWEKIELHTIGIPFPSPENHSKIVFTSRSLDVCGLMEAQKMIRVQSLSPEDAWNLFSKKVGECTLNVDPKIKEVAQKVCDECEGLPLMINTLGLAMSSKKTLPEWEFVLKRISTKGLGDEKILANLALSYHSLRNETTKSCFLYLCFFASTRGERCDEKNDLVLQWFAEGLLDDVDNENYYDVLNWGHSIISELQSAGLCDVDSSIYYVCYKVHDLIIEMGQWVASKGRGKYYKRFPTHADKMHYEDAERIFLCESDIKELITPPDCPNLSTLVLYYNCYLTTIPDDFFNSMPNLRVLNLSGCDGLETLPEGICALKSLRYLNIQGTSIKRLHVTIQELTGMQILRLDFLAEVPSGIISSFKGLLHFRCSGSGCKSLGNKLLEELDSLKRFKSLELEELPYSSESFNFLTTSRNLLDCIFKLGILGRERPHGSERSRIENIDISFLSDMKCLESFTFAWFDKLVSVSCERTFAFRSLISVIVSHCRALEDISDLLISSTNLEHLHVSFCPSMKAILKKEASDRCFDANLKPFGRLQKLSLVGMRTLEYICPNNQQFPYLSWFHADMCPLLHKLPFTPTNAGQLSCISCDRIFLDDLQCEDEEIRAFIHDKIRVW